MIWSLSLAPLKYNNVTFEKFFESLSTKKHRLLGGEHVFTANSYLKKELVPDWKPQNQLYSTCDGSGTSKYKNEAVYKSISEGLERLAFYQNHDNVDLGFHIDCSTTGMAAYPGIFKSYARRLAYYEAIERWSLQMFWKGLMPIEKLKSIEGENVFRFKIPFREAVAVLIYRDMTIGQMNRRVYGFASSSNTERALKKSRIELDRNFEVFSLVKALDYSTMNLQEKRLVYFSEKSGIDQFDEVCKNALKSKVQMGKPKILVDSQIMGSWNPYCDIYRVLFEGMSSANTRVDEFLF